MESRNMEPGYLRRQEEAALEDEVRRDILDLIGLDLVRIKVLEEEMELKEQDLKNHLVMLEKALLVEQEEGGYRLTPRCIAYLDECQGYEWRR
jgi:predicted transcriptional regulator